MTLLRVSGFCQPAIPRRTEVSLQVTTKQLADDNDEAPRTKKNHHHHHHPACCCSVGWVTPEVLIVLSIPEGSLAWLSFGINKVVLRLFLKSDTGEEEEFGTDEDVFDGVPSLKIFVPPVVAINLGISGLGGSCILESAGEAPESASHVVLRPLGRPASWPRLSSSSSVLVENKDEFWVFPLANTLIQKEQVLSVYDHTADRICHYYILEAKTEHDGSDILSDCCWITTSSTTFQLDDSVLSGNFDVPQLPCLLSQRNYFQSTCVTPQQPTSTIILPPHPNRSELVQAFRLSPKSLPSERVVHVIGTNREHDLCLAVESAAQEAGRTCWSLRGLAAFGYSVGHTVRTGSLIDQLAGLDAALEEIRRRRMEPCVLHLYDLDAELSTNDDPLRHEQEERIWAKLLQALSRTTLKSEQEVRYAPPESSSSRRFTCPLIIAISTTAPLKPGPWMQNMVFPSVVMAIPDPMYTQFLWKATTLDDETAGLLRGRNVGEIRKIRQAIVGKEGTNEAIEEIIKLCSQLDSQRRKQRSATVSQVHWEDVGGMAHVRDEIMDAIELPLRHPHLFPSGRGRSGILLYGPPGTGKTLVAKAVATECGLPFLSIKGPELLGSYVGESEANVRAVFQSARDAAEQNAPVAASILFFDELDSLAPKRGGVGDGGGVMERVVATLFAELDGDTASSSSGRVFILGATNRPDLLDPSLLRPGRLDRSVYLGIATDPGERARILAAQLHKLKLERDALELSKEVVARLPPRLTGADFSTIASGALLHAVDRLCRLADEELNLASQNNAHKIELRDILQGWDEEKCTPTVLLEDILEASKHVTPSVSQVELDRYERLKTQYNGDGPGPIEHEGDVFY